MAIIRIPALLIATATTLTAAEPLLEQAEVRIPYSELRRLIAAGTEDPAKRPELAPALLSARIHIALADGVPVLDASFRAVRLAGGPSLVPLVGGDVVLDHLEPADAPVVARDGMLCHVGDLAGTLGIEARLRVTGDAGQFELKLPLCPTAVLEMAGSPAQTGALVRFGTREQVLAPGAQLALPADVGTMAIRLLSGDETREALRPPQPSVWSWQHQALVTPAESELIYQIIARGSATGGSGLDATLTLPPDSRGVQATGDDLATFHPTRDADGNQRLRIEWATRGVLERELEIRYRVPLRPLDQTWQLAAPAGATADSTRTRFLIATSPQLAYSADGLSAPLPPESAPAALARHLDGNLFHHLEGTDHAALAIRRLPVVATADAVVSEATWSLRVEPDGALLAEGSLSIEHRTPQRVLIDTPDGMALLSCHLGGHPVEPVDLGDGKLEFALPAATDRGGKPTTLACSFTGRTEPLDPVEGTLSLSLPRTPLFIRALSWRVDLPAAYRAEVNGNVIRDPNPASDPPSTLRLRKNLCRDERPEVRVFYQKSDLLP